jgi:hypothetical protein
MTSNTPFIQPNAATPAPTRHPPPGTLPGAATYAVLATLMIPFFAVLHLVAALQSRHHWEDRVRPLRHPKPRPGAEPRPGGGTAAMTISRRRLGH